LDEIEKKNAGAESEKPDLASESPTLTKTEAPPPQPSEVRKADSPERTSAGKPYLEAIDVMGARAQKICLVAIAVLTALFFGFLLPSLGALQKVRDIRAEQSYVQSQIDIFNRKIEARRESFDEDPRRRPAIGAENNVDCRQKVQADFADAKQMVGELDDDFANQLNDRNRKESLTAFVRERAKKANEKIRTIDEFLQSSKNNCLQTQYPGARYLRDHLALVKLKAQQADITERLNAESARTIPLGILGVFGLKLDGLEEARVPLLYLPILWSLLLLGLLLYASQKRSSMLNMYARALRVVDSAALLKELGALSRSAWWWLAPLPEYDGSKVTAKDLKFALGWITFELVAFLEIILLHFALLAMQATVFLISWRVTPILTADGELLAILIAIGLLTLWSTAVVVQWLWPWRKVPDFDANQEGPWHYRRTVVSMLVLGVVGILVIRRLAPAAERPRIRKSPRFRKRRPRKALVVNEQSLRVGFYMNKCTAVIHYVSLRRFPQPAQPRKRRKRRRIRLLRIESRKRQLLSSDRDVNGNGGPPKRLRETNFENRTAKLEKGKPDDLMIRGGWPTSRDPEKFMPVETEKIFLKPKESGTTDKVDGVANDSTKLPVGTSAPQRNHANQSRAENKVLKVQPFRPYKKDFTYKCSNSEPRLNRSQAAFAIEQEALRRLASIKHAPNTSREAAASVRNQVCDLLQTAISRGKDSGYSYLRLYDLLAVVALQNDREDILKWLIKFVANDSAVEVKARADRWAAKGKWRSRWSPTEEIGYRYKRKEWSGLPM
jgi:hypothetical protein